MEKVVYKSVKAATAQIPYAKPVVVNRNVMVATVMAWNAMEKAVNTFAPVATARRSYAKVIPANKVELMMGVD